MQMTDSFFPGWEQFFDMVLTCFWWGAAAIIAAIPLYLIAVIVYEFVLNK